TVKFRVIISHEAKLLGLPVRDEIRNNGETPISDCCNCKPPIFITCIRPNLVIMVVPKIYRTIPIIDSNTPKIISPRATFQKVSIGLLSLTVKRNKNMLGTNTSSVRCSDKNGEAPHRTDAMLRVNRKTHINKPIADNP